MQINDQPAAQQWPDIAQSPSTDRPASKWTVALLISLVSSVSLVLLAIAIDIAFDLGLLSGQSRLYRSEGPMFLAGMLMLVLAGHCGDRLEGK